jgi:hypothetical protein
MSNDGDQRKDEGVHDLTPRDCSAINLLLDRQIDALADNPRQAEMWRETKRRFQRDVSAKPESMAPALCAFLGAARAVNFEDIDRLGQQLTQALHRHGDLEGAKSFGRTLTTPYERPDLVQRKRGGRSDPTVAAHSGPSAQRPTNGASSNPLVNGHAKQQATQIVVRPDNPFIHWYEPTDLSGEMVLDDLCGPPMRRLIEELEVRDVLLANGIDAPTRILFHGPPGTGKTLGARYVGGALRKPVAAAKIGTMMSSYVAGTTQNLVKVISEAACEDAIIFLDEIETVAANRAAGASTHEEYKKATGALLQALDQLKPSIIVIAATNFPNGLDHALRSRLSYEVGFQYPDDRARSEQIKRNLKTLAADETAVNFLLVATAGKSGRFLRAVVMSAARAAIMAAPRKDGLPDTSQAVIKLEHCEPAIKQAADAEKSAGHTEREMKR